MAELGKAGWKRAAKALAEIREVSPDVTPEEIDRRAQNYRGHLGGAMLTSTALAKHWARCGTAAPPVPRRDGRRSLADLGTGGL